MLYTSFIEESLLIPSCCSQSFSINIVPRGDNRNDFLEWEQAVRYLESKGFIVSAKTKEFPAGVYIAEGLTNEGKLKGWNLDNKIPLKIIVKNIVWPFQTIIPKKPDTNMGLKVVAHHTMGFILGSKQKGWGKLEIIPYGIFGLSLADTSGIQYGQSGFEGACAMKNKKGETFGFRLNKNAERFNKSLQSVYLPSIDPDIIQKGIETTISNNIDYIPDNGDGQLYIRPSFSGLSGGLGIIVPDYFLITIEIAAMGSYMAPSIKIEGRKDIQRPATGANKIAPNYGSSFLIKKGVKERGYTDYLSFDKNGYTEEVGTSAIAFIDTKGVFVFPPVQDEIDTKDRHILPSITRYSTIEMLRKLGETVEIRDVHADEISEFEGVFTMGNAVGLVHVEKICMKESESDAGKILNFVNEKIKIIIFDMKEKLFSARIGELEGFERWAKKLG